MSKPKFVLIQPVSSRLKAYCFSVVLSSFAVGVLTGLYIWLLTSSYTATLDFVPTITAIYIILACIFITIIVVSVSHVFSEVEDSVFDITDQLREIAQPKLQEGPQ